MKSRDLFGYIKNGQFRTRWKYRHMTRLEHDRLLKRGMVQKGRRA